VTSSIFTEITFPNEFGTDDKEAYISYLETEKYNCSEQNDLEISFKYMFPFVNFKGKLDIRLYQEGNKNRVIYSGVYQDNITIKKLCRDSLKGEIGLFFTRKKDGATCNFYSSNTIEAHKEKERLQFYITVFELGKNDFKILD